MTSPNQKHAINKKLVTYWREKMLYWLLCQEFDLKKDTLDQLGMECALDAMNTIPYHLAKVRQELFDLGATEEDIANPGFLNQSTNRGPMGSAASA